MGLSRPSMMQCTQKTFMHMNHFTSSKSGGVPLENGTLIVKVSYYSNLTTLINCLYKSLMDSASMAIKTTLVPV